MSIKYTKIFHSEAFQNIPQLGFLVRKYTIWQPCLHPNEHLQKHSPFLAIFATNRRLVFSHFLLCLIISFLCGAMALVCNQSSQVFNITSHTGF
jgi:hypothetical protein